MEVLVKFLKRQPQAKVDTEATQRVYTAIDGTFVNAQEAKRHFEAKAAIVFTDERVTVSRGRNVLLNKQYVGSCQTVKEFGEKLFLTTTEMGINGSTELVILGDGAPWIWKLAQTRTLRPCSYWIGGT